MADVLWDNIVKRSPVTLKGFRRPSTGCFDDFGRGAGDEKFGSSPNSEAVACGVEVTE